MLISRSSPRFQAQRAIASTQSINVDGIPLNVIDTAGLRDAADEVEQLGIARTLAEIERADVVVHLIDATSVEQQYAVLDRVKHRSASVSGAQCRC